MTAPEIRTERLLLRAYRREDLPALLRIWSDPRVTRHFSGLSLAEDEIWTKITRAVGHWQLMGYGYWVVADRTGDICIGEVGFADFRRGIGGIDTPYEGGWALDADRHGEGIGREMVEAAHDWLDRTFDAPRTACLIHPENAASLALAAAFGYRQTGSAVYRDEPSLILHRTPDRLEASADCP